MIAHSSEPSPTIESAAPSGSGGSAARVARLGHAAASAATAPASRSGTLTRNTDPHEKCASRMPPASGPSAMPTPIAPPQMPIARARAGRLGEDVVEDREGRTGSSSPHRRPSPRARRSARRPRRRARRRASRRRRRRSRTGTYACALCGRRRCPRPAAGRRTPSRKRRRSTAARSTVAAAPHPRRRRDVEDLLSMLTTSTAVHRTASTGPRRTWRVGVTAMSATLPGAVRIHIVASRKHRAGRTAAPVASRHETAHPRRPRGDGLRCVRRRRPDRRRVRRGRRHRLRRR